MILHFPCPFLLSESRPRDLLTWTLRCYADARMRLAKIAVCTGLFFRKQWFGLRYQATVFLSVYDLLVLHITDSHTTFVLTWSEYCMFISLLCCLVSLFPCLFLFWLAGLCPMRACLVACLLAYSVFFPCTGSCKEDPSQLDAANPFDAESVVESEPSVTAWGVTKTGNLKQDCVICCPGAVGSGGWCWVWDLIFGWFLHRFVHMQFKHKLDHKKHILLQGDMATFQEKGPFFPIGSSYAEGHFSCLWP